LVDQAEDSDEQRPGRSRFRVEVRPALAFGVAVVLLAAIGIAVWAARPSSSAVVGASPSPGSPAASPSEATSSPDAVSTSPYQLLLVASTGSQKPLITVATPADCQPMPTDWLRSFCTLTLRSDWRTIIAPSDPFAPPPNAYSSVTFLASLARAEIDGDTSFCADVTIREFLSASPGGSAPAPGATNPPRHPIATCIGSLQATAGAGSFTVTDPDNEQNVKVLVGAGAAPRAAAGSAPAFDPAVACQAPLTRDACEQLIDATTAALGSRTAATQDLIAYAPPVTCGGGTSPCPPPTNGIWLGSVVAGEAGARTLVFDAAEVGGQLKVTEIPIR
jgi:hypothetical protein